MRYFANALAVALICLVPLHANAAVSPQVDTIALWNTDCRHHKGDVRLYAYRPENPNGIAIVVCPGGSYFWLDEKGEGHNVGKWLCSNGITAFVLMYRTAGTPEFVWHTRTVFRGIRHPDMITDAQLALKWVWDHSQDYSVDQGKIGIMGFSAGGHLALSTACFHKMDFLLGRRSCEEDRFLKPAFVAAIYPVVTMKGKYAHRRSRRGLFGDRGQSKRNLRDSMSLENHIPAECPPIFVINCKDDPVVDYRNSELLDSALNAAGIEHRYIQYSTGKHGFGVSDHYGSPESRRWRIEFLEWVNKRYCDCSL